MKKIGTIPAAMKAIVTTGNGGYEKLEYREVPGSLSAPASAPEDGTPWKTAGWLRILTAVSPSS
jgi:hypothetical protein